MLLVSDVVSFLESTGVTYSNNIDTQSHWSRDRNSIILNFGISGLPRVLEDCECRRYTGHVCFGEILGYARRSAASTDSHSQAIQRVRGSALHQQARDVATPAA